MKSLDNSIGEEVDKKSSKLTEELSKIQKSENVKLTLEQKNDYEFWVNKKTEFNPYKNERDYLIKNLIFQLYFLNQKKAFLICEKKGHKEKVLSSSNHGIFAYCERCENYYQRPMDQSELKSWQDLLRMEFTI